MYAGITLFIMVPAVLLLAIFTDIGPIGLYFYVKIVDILRIIVFHFWLKRERWLRNLTTA